MVAACVEVEIDRQRGEIKVNEVCEAFECGPVQNPANLVSQVQGCIMMGMGPALREAIRFEDGKILNAGFADYRVPRFKDMPKIDVHLVDNTGHSLGRRGRDADHCDRAGHRQCRVCRHRPSHPFDADPVARRLRHDPAGQT